MDAEVFVMKMSVFKVLAGLVFLGAAISVSAQSRTIDVWDFGGVAEDKASNHISVSDLEHLEQLGADGKFTVDGTIQFGDLAVTVVKNDRAYNGGKKNYGSQGYASYDFEDGYTSSGIYYCNGKGGENRRCITLSNVRAGDVVTFYARLSNSGDETIHFASLAADGSKDGRQDETAVVTNESLRYSYIALYSGTYKIYCDAAVGKPVYYRVVRVPAVEVSGNLASLPAGKAELKFVVKETNQEIPAKISGKSYTAGLPAGYTYTAVLTGIKGYGIDAASKQLVLDGSASGAVKKNLTVSEQKTYVVSGTLNGFDKNYVPQTPVRLIMTPPAGSLYMPVEIEVKSADGVYSFSDLLEPSVAYTAVLSGGEDYEISGDAVFEGTAAFTKDITVAPKAVYDVSGVFFGEVSELPGAVQFKNMADGYIYDGTISGGAYSVSLRDGSYEVLCRTEKTASMNHIVVDGAPVSKNIKLSAVSAEKTPLPLKKDLYVGGKKGQYATVADAVAAAAAMNPQSERDRITIHIAPGVYRAQLLINTPYITLKNDTPAREVKFTWYYGIGYNYYSADANGWYNADLAYDKFSKKGVAKWGGATYIQSGAKAFRAEGITFETSFNKYVTDEEIADGVEMDGSFNFNRKLNSDVRAKAATERSAAILIEADETEFIGCSFLGSQDTFYTGAGIKGYVRNSLIEGNTDFIFGDGDFVFENCEIRWAGYTDRFQSGYLTAARTSSQKGYLFYNCLVSKASDSLVASGYFGRPWGKDAAVAWVNTVFGSDDVIGFEGWTSMSGNAPEKARFMEINSTWNGEPVDSSERTSGTTGNAASGYEPADYFGGWKPAFYSAAAGAQLKVKKANFTTDDDINTPYPGHTITVHYAVNKKSAGEDMSLIQWYRDKDGTSELVKQSAGYADKTYLIQSDDTGAVIRCVVTPQGRGGEKEKPVEAKLDAAVNAGYAAPANVAADRPRVTGAVNVFLASDSTCKDYSAAGMWNGGQTRNEGAWGEFIQDYFNGAVAVQNYANGGRSSRNFINEGSLDKIAQNIAKGDYLFIQFGHNDCSNSAGYLEDRYVPLGKPDAKGIYPTTAGKKVATPASYASRYGDTFYSYDNGGTYKWYLKQYIDVARNAGATPVLVTPISRQYFTAEGTIRPHHDSTDPGTKTLVTTDNAYVEAVRQLAKEENVLLIDGFELTKRLYEKAYSDNGGADEARKLMFQGDSTHNNKLGGFIIAGEFARAIKTQVPQLGKSIVRPAKAIGENADGSLMFTVDSSGTFSCDDAYWTNYTQKLLDSLGK